MNQLEQDLEEHEVDLLAYWAVIRKRLVGIVALVVVASVGALVYGLRIPPVFEARATILTPKESGGGGGLSRRPSSRRVPCHF